MSKIIIYENGGNLHVVIPAPDFLKNKDALNRIIEKDIPSDADYEIINSEDLPSDRTFRSAWIQDGASIKIDMPKARTIHMDTIRVERDKQLTKTDEKLLRAIEDGIDTDSLKEKRQALRDIPQTLDLGIAQTPEELKGLWPFEP